MFKHSATKLATVFGFTVGVLMISIAYFNRANVIDVESDVHVMGGDSTREVDLQSNSRLDTGRLSRRDWVLIDIAELYAISDNLQQCNELLMNIYSPADRDIATYVLIQRLNRNHGFFRNSPKKDVDKLADDKRVVNEVRELVPLVSRILDPMLKSEMLCFAAEARSKLPAGVPGVPSTSDLLDEAKRVAVNGNHGAHLLGRSIELITNTLISCWSIVIPAIMAFGSYLAARLFETTYSALSKHIAEKIDSVVPLAIDPKRENGTFVSVGHPYL